MLANLSVRIKLIAVISIFLITLAGTGLFALTRMQTMNDYTVDISTKWLPAVDEAATVDANAKIARGRSYQPV